MEGVFVALLRQERPWDEKSEQPGQSPLPPAEPQQKVVRVNVPFTTKEDGVEELWVIVPAAIAEASSNRPSEKSLFAQAFLGKKEGDVVQVSGPKGDEFSYQILWIGD